MAKSFRVFLVFATIGFVYGFFYPQSGNKVFADDVKVVIHSHAAKVLNPALAPVVGVQFEQGPSQPPAEGDKECERPDPKDPKVGATDPHRVGCTCMRKCINGKPSENYDDESKRCKVHCKPDRCHCPNPCDKT